MYLLICQQKTSLSVINFTCVIKAYFSAAITEIISYCSICPYCSFCSCSYYHYFVLIILVALVIHVVQCVILVLGAAVIVSH